MANYLLTRNTPGGGNVWFSITHPDRGTVQKFEGEINEQFAREIRDNLRDVSAVYSPCQNRIGIATPGGSAIVGNSSNLTVTTL